MNIIFYLSMSPTINSYYQSGYGHTKHLSAAARNYRDEAQGALREQGFANINLEYKMLLEVIIYPPDKRIRDLDNYMKGLLDACTHAGVWKDDSLIDQLFIYRGEVMKGGLIQVEISKSGPIRPAPRGRGTWTQDRPARSL